MSVLQLFYATNSAVGSDFKAVEKSIHCGEVEDEFCIDITIEEDLIAEGDESFAVSISGLGSCMSSKLQQAVVVIMDNDQSQALQRSSSSGSSLGGASILSQQPQNENNDMKDDGMCTHCKLPLTHSKHMQC